MRLARIVRRAFYVKLSLVFAVLLVAGVAYLRLVAGPVSLQDYSQRVGDELASRLGPGWSVALSDTALQLQGAKPAIRAFGLKIRNPAGVLVVDAPYAVVSVDPRALLSGSLMPSEVDLRGLQLRAMLAADGTLSFVAPSAEAASASPGVGPAPPLEQPADTAAAERKPSPLSQAVSSLLAPLLRPTSLIGALERAAVSDAKLTLVGQDGRERVAFNRVEALFERGGETARRLNVQLTGPRGFWSVGGEVRDEPDGKRLADLQATDVPLEDVLLLTGLSALPGRTDLKLSGSISAALVEGRLTVLDGRFESSAGIVQRAGQPPLRVDRAAGQASWDEARRRLELPILSAKSGDTQVQLAGELVAAGDGGWQLKLGGRDSVVAGVTDRDPAFRVANLAAEVNFDERGIVVDKLSLEGDQLDVKIRGSSTAGPDGTGVRATVDAKDTNIRRFLRLWPDTVNPDLRAYLVANLQSGTVERMRLKAELGAPDLKAMTTDAPLPDPALSLTFSLSDARLTVMSGLPPLSRLSVEGKASGTKTSLASRGGQIELPGGRRLDFSDGSYVQTDLGQPGSIARIGFRLGGGADAVAAFLRSPVLREATAFDIDPASLKGKVDFKVSLPLDPKRIPRAADLPIVVGGTVTELSADRIMGRERLDGGNLTILYDSGALSVKGDGRIGGAPATFDIRQPRGGPGEITANVTLDEGARARRGLPSAPRLTGPVAVKVSAPFGGGKGPARLEADLARASVNELLPGWNKPAGRPGRAAFLIPDGDGAELKDFVLESGPVQVRGHVTLDKDGAFDKADFTTLKLSPGDDMRAQIERVPGTYRVTLRGNVGDARPVLKWLNGPPGTRKEKEALDIELEAAVNIVTGHNDEAMTGVTARLSARDGEIRRLQVGGQFRQARLDAQLVAREGAPPLISVQSGDGGAALRFLDIYKRMSGGRLEAQVVPGDVQTGSVTIASFGLRNEPALKSIASAPVSTGSLDDRASSQLNQLTSDQVQFSKLTAEFRRSSSRVDYNNVVIYGPAVGFNLQGYVDYGRDRTDILGTFVPAFGLNNAFSQVPLVGPILGGDRNEGLFAIDFKVSGLASAPTLTVNPLTIVAPGILRKLFGWMMPEPETMATGTTAPRPAPAPTRRPARPN